MSYKRFLPSFGLILMLTVTMAAPVSAQGCSRRMDPFDTSGEAEFAAQMAKQRSRIKQLDCVSRNLTGPVPGR